MSNLGSLKSQIQWRAPISCQKKRGDRKRVGTLASLPIFDCGVTMSSSTIYYRSEVKLGKSLAFIFLKIGTRLEHIWCKTPVSLQL